MRVFENAVPPNPFGIIVTSYMTHGDWSKPTRPHVCWGNEHPELPVMLVFTSFQGSHDVPCPVGKTTGTHRLVGHVALQFNMARDIPTLHIGFKRAKAFK